MARNLRLPGVNKWIKDVSPRRCDYPDTQCIADGNFNSDVIVELKNVRLITATISGFSFLGGEFQRACVARETCFKTADDFIEKCAETFVIFLFFGGASILLLSFSRDRII